MSEKKCFICKELEIYDNGKTCYSCDEDSFNIGKKQGAVEELERIRNQLDVLPKRHFKEYLRSAIIKRIEELKGD
jgi:hypothetical protein